MDAGGFFSGADDEEFSGAVRAEVEAVDAESAEEGSDGKGGEERRDATKEQEGSRVAETLVEEGVEQQQQCGADGHAFDDAGEFDGFHVAPVEPAGSHKDKDVDGYDEKRVFLGIIIHVFGP